MDALKAFFFPSLTFPMITARIQKRQLDKVGRLFKKTLNILQDASNDYIYGPGKTDCVVIPGATEKSDHYLTDSAFKLLTTKDTPIKQLALDDLQTTMQKRIGREVYQQDLAAYLSGENDGEFRRNTNALSTIWTNARKASTRNEVEWAFENIKLLLTFDF